MFGYERQPVGGGGEVDTTQLFFDGDEIALEARYADELSAYRAKRVWKETFESYFLLENESDYVLSTAVFEGQEDEEAEGLGFLLRCHFTSACARYAFWRITNAQASEAQFILETAHVPFSEQTWLRHQLAPEFQERPHQQPQDGDEAPLILNHDQKTVEVNKSWFGKFEGMLEKLVRSFDALPEKNEPSKK
ncbi:hypothetical protein MRY87_04270 [bacterium]|nr:hypothetical protein [bacterium]